jgi:hypothetical protein
VEEVREFARESDYDAGTASGGRSFEKKTDANSQRVECAYGAEGRRLTVKMFAAK